MPVYQANKESSVASVNKIMRILNCFSYRRPELSAADIGRILDLPTATLYRHLQMLEGAGLIERDQVTHLYSLSLHIVELSGIALSRYEVRRLGQVNLDNLCSKLSMNANLAVLYECDTFHLCYSVYKAVDTAYTTLGRRSPAPQTAMGRILLSSLPDPEWRRLVHQYGLRPRTSCSIRDIDQLAQELKKCREQGYAADIQSISMNCCCFAAPVFSRMGIPIAAISVSTTPERFKEEFELIRNNVMDEALELSYKLGYYHTDNI